MRTIPRREGAADVVGVDVDLGLALDAIKVAEVDLTRAGVAAEDEIAPVAVDAITAGGDVVVVLVADAIFAAVEDAIAAFAADAISADDDVVVVVVADAILVAVNDAIAAFAADAISTAGEGVVEVVVADAGVEIGRAHV